jgi:hypothetical protein
MAYLLIATDVDMVTGRGRGAVEQRNTESSEPSK